MSHRPLPIAAITLADFGPPLGLATPIGRQRSTLIVTFLDPSASVSPHIPLIAARGNQFAFGSLATGLLGGRPFCSFRLCASQPSLHSFAMTMSR